MVWEGNELERNGRKRERGVERGREREMEMGMGMDLDMDMDMEGLE